MKRNNGKEEEESSNHNLGPEYEGYGLLTGNERFHKQDNEVNTLPTY